MTATTDPKEHPFTSWTGDDIVTAYLDKLPAAESEAQHQAARAMNDGRYSEVKILAACHLTDNYVKALGYLSSVPKVTEAGLPTLPTLLSEAARAIAEALRDRNIEEEKLEPELRENARSIWLYDLNELNQNIFRRSLEGLNR